MKILLVDDDEFLRDMYATKFGQLGHEVSVAESGEVALQKLRETTFEVVLMDMIMPSLSGLELLQRIKTEKLGGNPVCIMLSNQSEDADKKGAQELGAAGYIVKAEFIPSEVVDQVMKIVAGNT